LLINIIFNAAAVGHGARTRAINKIEIKILICALTSKPLLAISTALLAKISTGTYKAKPVKIESCRLGAIPQ